MATLSLVVSLSAVAITVGALTCWALKMAKGLTPSDISSI